jgi:hypothetical protein
MHASNTRDPGTIPPPPPPASARAIRIQPSGRIRVSATDPRRTQRAIAAEQRIGSVANLLDDLVPVPGTGSRVGLDPVLGLVPFLGDVVSGVMSAWIVAEAARFGVPGIVIVRMLINAGVDFAIGLVPFLGDLVDFGFKGNRRNLELFHRHALDPGADTTGSKALVIGTLLVALGIGWLIVVVLARILSTVVG